MLKLTNATFSAIQQLHSLDINKGFYPFVVSPKNASKGFYHICALGERGTRAILIMCEVPFASRVSVINPIMSTFLMYSFLKAALSKSCPTCGSWNGPQERTRVHGTSCIEQRRSSYLTPILNLSGTCAWYVYSCHPLISLASSGV